MRTLPIITYFLTFQVSTVISNSLVYVKSYGLSDYITVQSRLTTAAHRESQQFFKSLESQVEISGNQNFEVLVIKFEVLWYCQKLFVDCRNIRVTELTAEVDNSLSAREEILSLFSYFSAKKSRNL